MRPDLIVFTMALGVVLTVHLAMNGNVGAVLNNARVGNALFWIIGAITACLIGAAGWRPGALAGLRQVNPILLTAGAMGACLVFAIAWLIPRMGAGPMTMSLLAGQILGGLLLSHFGWLGSPVQPATLMKLAGAGMMLIGVYLSNRG